MFKGSVYKKLVGELVDGSEYTNLPIVRRNKHAQLNRIMAVDSIGANMALIDTSGKKVVTYPLDKIGEFSEGSASYLDVGGIRGEVCELSFSPFHDTKDLIAIGSSEGSIHVSREPGSITKLYAGDGEKVARLAFNPSASDCLVSASSTVKVWDLVKGREIFSSPKTTYSYFDADFVSDGSLVAATSKNGYVRIFDPRENNSNVATIKSHGGSKASKVVAMSPTHLLSTGFTRGGGREINYYDLRQSKTKAVFNKRIDDGYYALEPHYDPDSRLLFLASKTDRVIHVLEMRKKGMQIMDQLEDYDDNQRIDAVAMLPKVSVDVNRGEVVRFLRMSSNKQRVDGVSFRVSDYKVGTFNKEVYPKTFSLSPAVTLDEWLAGETRERPRNVSLNPEGDDDEDEPASQVQEGKGDDAEDDLRLTDKALKARGIVRRSLVRHVFIEEPKKSQVLYDISIKHTRLNEFNGISASEKYFAVPWVTYGKVAVFRVNERGGRSERDILPVILDHYDPVSIFTFSPHDPDKIVICGDNGTMSYFSVSKPNDAIFSRAVSKAKLTHAKFNPLAEGVLATSTYEGVVRLWDINRIESGSKAEHRFGGSSDSLEFSLDGNRLAFYTDKSIRVLDPRTKEVPLKFDAHQGIKTARVMWIGDTEQILSTGFSRMSKRELNLYDLRMGGKVISQRSAGYSGSSLIPFFDPDSKVAWLFSKGERNIRMYEIGNGEIYELSVHPHPEPIMAVAQLPRSDRDIKDVEVSNFIIVEESRAMKLRSKVPRQKKEYFQDDIYPPWYNPRKYTADEYFSGKRLDLGPKKSQNVFGMKNFSTLPKKEEKMSKFSVNKAEETVITREDVVDSLFERIERATEEVNSKGYMDMNEVSGVDSSEWDESSSDDSDW